VRGLAVVGHQPLLKPGEHFEYTSWTRISTPAGSMRGTFFCMTEEARPFEATVPEFALVYPGALH
jgi:ApaG protein